LSSPPAKLPKLDGSVFFTSGDEADKPLPADSAVVNQLEPVKSWTQDADNEVIL